MNKELTPLEALHKIANVEMKEQYKASKNGFVYRVISDEYSKELDIIEKALKEHELMKQTRIIVANKNISDEDLEKLKNQRMFVSSLKQGEIKVLFDVKDEKKLKALEIILKNYDFKVAKNNNAYWLQYWVKDDCMGQMPISKEEYDLLKEVLL